VLLLQCIVCCALLAIVILPVQYRDPLSMVMSYPPQVIRRVEALPQYQGKIRQCEKAHIGRKIVGIVVLVAVFATVAYLSGCRSFGAAFRHVFILLFAVNVFDLVVLDWGVFCHSKKLRISGTEDMDEAYRDRLFHLRGAALGTALNLVVALAAGGIVGLVG